VEAHKKLSLALASIVVNHDLRLKVVESIILHVTGFPADLSCYMASKADTQLMQSNHTG
jgi:hypothetical protein